MTAHFSTCPSVGHPAITVSLKINIALSKVYTIGVYETNDAINLIIVDCRFATIFELEILGVIHIF